METIWIPFVVAALIAFAATPFVIRIAPKIGAMDIPKDDRRVHKDPMPLMWECLYFCPKPGIS
jgi:UDP-GlcNAc:undecaprenyl-phosphate GlcNAc-1-phosphate transferase